ncbi:hypothetical protein NPIL_336371 [Nephila pilipes]|uniref:Uncharacterized protein n=1 Tax=Nephila pilipes TaxID=299642 RepID=A0A8X6QWR9_NEPPI|nr:hypothetical protein NPIL_336371 [Nephila pilipes]
MVEINRNTNLAHGGVFSCITISSPEITIPTYTIIIFIFFGAIPPEGLASLQNGLDLTRLRWIIHFEMLKIDAPCSSSQLGWSERKRLSNV